MFLMLQIFLKVSADDCNRINSTCCYNEHVDNNTNECVDCINGSFGWNCESPCVRGYYGFLCKTPCECLHYLCDKETGCHSQQNETSTNYTPTTFSTINFEKTVSQEKSTESSVQETTNQDVKIETSNQKRNTIQTSVPSVNSSEGRLHNFMSNAILFFIGSITTVFIGGTFICFRKRFTRIFINRYQGRTQPSTRTPPTDRDSGYDEIRYSQLLRNSNICAEVGASSPGYSSKSQYLLSIIYDNYDDDDGNYSRLLLKQNHGTNIPKRNILLEDEGYAFLQTSDIRELKTDIVVQQHQSLPSFATIENPISTEFKPLTRCLSENDIIYLKPLLSSSVVFLEQQKIR